MKSLPITFVFQQAPELPDRDPSAADEYARFLDELAQYATSPIRTMQELREVPEMDFIVFAGADAHATLNRCPTDQQASLARRLVPINASQPKIFDKLLERLSLPAAIDALSFWMWKGDEPDHVGARGLWGLRDIAPVIGAKCTAFESQRYCHFESATHRGLPHLLADYLEAYRSAGGSKR